MNIHVKNKTKQWISAKKIWVKHSDLQCECWKPWSQSSLLCSRLWFSSVTLELLLLCFLLPHQVFVSYSLLHFLVLLMLLMLVCMHSWVLFCTNCVKLILFHCLTTDVICGWSGPHYWRKNDRIIVSVLFLQSAWGQKHELIHHMLSRQLESKFNLPVVLQCYDFTLLFHSNPV